MKTKTISRILTTVAISALSVSSLLAQSNLGACCGCPSPVKDRPSIDLGTSAYTNSDGELINDLRLDCKHNWVLSKKIYVPNGKTITIDPGTVIRGTYTGHTVSESVNATALIIERGGKIIAEGTPCAPIVFTTNGGTTAEGTLDADDLDGKFPIGKSGSWGGLVLLGKATNNLTLAKNSDEIPNTNNDGKKGLCHGTDGVGYIEGFNAALTNGSGELMNCFGGTDDADNSGVLKYVSIRHAGAWIADGNELNGLTLGSVGSGTTVEHIEVISNDDDDIEFFGGAVNAKYISLLFGADDMLDMDLNYHGKIQFVFGLKDPSNSTGYNYSGSSDNGIETDLDDNAASPVAAGRLYSKVANITMMSNFNDAPTADNSGPAAIQAKELNGGEIYNSIFVGFRSGLHLATARSTTSATYKLGDAYNNWTAVGGPNVDPTMTNAVNGSLKVKYNTFVNNTYNITKGALISGKNPAVSATPTAASADDLAQFTADGNRTPTTLPGMGVSSTSFAMSNYDKSITNVHASNNNTVNTAFDLVPNYPGSTVPADLAANTSVYSGDAFFTSVNYRGAFEPNKNASWLGTFSYNTLLKTTKGLSGLGLNGYPSDINGDGRTDVSDFLLFSPNFNKDNQ